MLTSLKEPREGWQHPPRPSSHHFHALTSFLSGLERRGELGLTLGLVACFTSGILPSMVARRTSRAAEKQSLLVFLTLQKGVY